MKLIAKIFAGLVGLWIILMVVGFMLPGHYRVERSTVIFAKQAAIFPHVADLRAWSQWSVWFQRDPGMEIAYSRATTDVGSWSRWKSQSQGDGKMTISYSHRPDSFAYVMEFSDVGMVSRGTMGLAKVADGTTRVTMAMEGDLGRHPMYRWLGLFMGELIGPDFEAGLANMKRISEAPAR